MTAGGLETGANGPSLSMEALEHGLHNLFDQFRVVEHQHQLIAELDKAILASGSSASDVLQLIVLRAREHTSSQHCHIVVVHRDALVVQASSEIGFVNTALPFDKSLCGKAIADGKDYHSGNVGELEASGHYHRTHEDTRSELALLIRRDSTSRSLGVLNFERSALGLFDVRSLSFAQLLAGQAAIALEHARISLSLEVLNRAGIEVVSGQLGAAKAYRHVLFAVLEAMNFEHGQVLRVVGKEFVIVASSRSEDIGLRVGKDNSVCGRYLLAEGGRKALYIDDLHDSSYGRYFAELLKTQDKRPMRSEMIVPIFEGDQLYGALNIESPQVRAFYGIDETLVGLAASMLVQTLKATATGTSRLVSSRIEAANTSMARLGSITQSYLHDFGGRVARVRAVLATEHESLTKNAGMDRGLLTTRLNQAIKELDDFGMRIGAFHHDFRPGEEYRPRELELAELVDQAVQQYKQDSQEEACAIGFKNLIPFRQLPGGETVRASSACALSDELIEVVHNLLNNAVDATRERRARGEQGYAQEIFVQVDLPDPMSARLLVSDNGVGIPDNIRERVFEPNFSTKRRKGRGIGLWFCRLYVEGRGGTILISTIQGGGTSFILEFPTVLALPVQPLQEETP